MFMDPQINPQPQVNPQITDAVTQLQPPPPSTPDMLDQLIQDTINNADLNKDVQAKIILTLAQAIETLARPELEMIKLQQPQAPQK